VKFAYLIEPPFNFRDSKDTVRGCDVDLARHVAEALDLGPFEPIETEFAELLPGLTAGRWRLTTGLFDTPERQRAADFTRPVWALPDGILVPAGNPKGLTGYRAIAEDPDCILAVIRDQFQHRSAVALGVPEDRIRLFETYAQAVEAVRDGVADAYASVDRAHAGFIDRHPDGTLTHLAVPVSEKPPAFGAFACAPNDRQFRDRVDAVLAAFIGTPDHRRMMADYGFSDAEIDLLLVA